jgi:serine/threonine protein kinase
MIDKLIGNYRVTAELAQGGMGAVYRGRHQNLPREVVVKSILLSSFPPKAQAHLKARFVREAYVQSQLDHPNIVRVYEFFTTEENYYLVMEFVDGMSLRELLERRGALDPDHALPIFKQALSALSYAHNFIYVDEAGRRLTGITHRDIKPANLLLDGMARLKLTDFGIVKLAGESSMTRTGFNPGTYEYMSPEQIRGLEVDARSDIYSLGVTFYEALAGRLPFPPGETGSEYEVMKGHTELAPPPLEEVRPGVPPELAKMTLRALEKDPAHRFQTAAEWLDAVLDYEQNRATVPVRRTEAVATELDAGRRPPPPVPVPATEVYAPKPIAKTEAAPVFAPESPSLSPPSAGGSGRMGLIVGGMLLLVVLAAVAAYLFMQRSDAPTGTTTEVAPPSQSTASPAATTTPAPAVQEDDRIRRARVAEGEERYPEAIKLYGDYLTANPNAADYASVKAHLDDIKKFNGHLAAAKFFLDKGDFAEAETDYAEALKLRRDSKLAQAGLAAAKAGKGRGQ